MKAYTIEEFKYLCSLLYHLFKIPLSFVDCNNKQIFEINDVDIQNPVENFRDKIENEVFNNSPLRLPKVYTTNLFENFLIQEIMNDSLTGTLIFGPSLVSPITSEAVDSIFINSQLSSKDKYLIGDYYNSLVVMNYHQLIKLSIFIHYIVHNEKLAFNSIIDFNSEIHDVYSSIENEYNFNIADYRDRSFFHRTSKYERNLYNLIKMGEIEKLHDLMQKRSIYGEQVILAKNNPLRSWKNLVICFTTLASRAAIEGGLGSEQTFILSDAYIQKLEELTTIKDVEDLANTILFDLCERVKNLKALMYSKTVIMCKTYIFQHIKEKIRVSDLAKFLNIDKCYLSDLFKKEIGIPISEYIQIEKINEAKRMLSFTHRSILEIYTSLSFCDQSHFTKTFKRITGQTPKQYRSSYPVLSTWQSSITRS